MNGGDVVLGAWMSYTTQSGNNTLNYQYLDVQGLAERQDHILEMYSGNSLASKAQFRTLPIDLPSAVEDPLTVLLGSCFCSSRSESVSIGAAYLDLQRLYKTDLKILCGDQVYLDDPTLHFTLHTHTPADLEDRLFANYLRTWTQMGGSVAGGFSTGNQSFLQGGANFFTSDDHEFWNNAPSWATLIRDTWSQQGRDTWRQIASSLLEVFQSRVTMTQFNVGNVSFFMADTRFNRDANRQRFMSDNDLAALRTWVSGLTGLGVLVVGQPIFDKKAGWTGALTDWGLPDYQQFNDLVPALAQTDHSILVLTGDVHFGRVAFCQLKDQVYLYEIISSPTALVNPAVGGKWKAAPDLFPADSISGTVSAGVSTDANFKFTANHFLTLSFSKDGADTQVIVRAVEIKGNGQPVSPVEIARLSLR